MSKPDAKTATDTKTAATDTKTATDTKIVVEKASKQTREKAWKNAVHYLKPSKIDTKAMLIFVKEDYMIRHPVETIGAYDAIDFAGRKEWREMSAREKSPFIKTAMEMMERMLKPITNAHG